MARLFLLALAALRLAAQQPEFEVVSVKRIGPNVPHMSGTHVYPGGRVILAGMALKTLIMVAYRTSFWQISGGEPWMDQDIYNVEAKPPEAARSSIKTLRYTLYAIEDERLRQMLQALLAQRFQLKLHRETRTGDVYELKRSGKPLALQPMERPAGSNLPDDPKHFSSVGYVRAKWVISATSMEQLAKFAADNILHAPVTDRTELKGLFEYEQRVPDDAPNYADPSDSFLNVIAQVGLKLERSKGPVEIQVIDGAAKPAEN
jgi:uncharacterized protein (TIGR03435 family)